MTPRFVVHTALVLFATLVEGRAIEEAEIAEAFTYVQLLPGAVVVQVVAYLGYRLRGWRGVAIATACFLLPSVVTMLLLAAAYRRVAAVPGVPAALNGLTSAVVGLIALAAYKQARKTVKDALGNIISNRVAVVIILPMASIGAQSRPGSPLAGITSYLEAGNSDFDNVFTLSAANSLFNDRLVFITIDELIF